MITNIAFKAFFYLQIEFLIDCAHWAPLLYHVVETYQRVELLQQLKMQDQSLAWRKLSHVWKTCIHSPVYMSLACGRKALALWPICTNTPACKVPADLSMQYIQFTRLLLRSTHLLTDYFIMGPHASNWQTDRLHSYTQIEISNC